MVMARGTSTTTPPEATLRGSGSGLVHVRNGLFSLLAVPGLGLLQLTSGATTGTTGTTTTTPTIWTISTFESPSTASTAIQTAIPTSTRTTNTTHDDNCRVTFLYPTADDRKFYHLDTLNVTYHSAFSNPTLHCWCNDPASNQVIEHLRIKDAIPFHGSVLVPLNFTSAGLCWFELRSDRSRDCRDRSETFALSSKQRHIGRALPTLGLDSSASILALRATVIDTSSAPSSAATQTPPAAAVATDTSRGGGESLGIGARVGLAIGLTFAVLGVGAMAAFLIFRRRKRHQDATLAGAILDHDRRHGRKGPEKPSRHLAPSVHSGNSDEPLYVSDGYPGSNGYDELEHSIQGHSPVMPHSPTFSHISHNTSTGHWGAPEPHHYSGREELNAARLNSALKPVTVSYGPNPVTPTLTPRPSPSPRVDLNVRPGNVSIDSREEDIPPMPDVSIMPPYITFGASHQPIPRMETNSAPSPPRKAAPPIVVSYGPNRVTPTPAVTTPTVPLDDAIVKRRIQTTTNHSNAAIRSVPIPPLESYNSWEDSEDEPMMAASTMGPLPPYATPEEFRQMEMGAVRKLPEPEAHELPPTKDGYYHDLRPVDHHELDGSVPQAEPQLPHDPYRQRAVSDGGDAGHAGPSNPSARSRGWREIDEQKFLLSDVEMAKLREEKVRQRAARLAEERERLRKQDQGQGESYRMEDVSASRSMMTR